MRVRLTKKFADVLDGVDLRPWRVGDVFLATRHEAELLLAEGWAEQVPDDAVADALSKHVEGPRTLPSPDRPREIKLGGAEATRQRRLSEDRIRDQLRDARAKTIRHDESV
jgi:hypothetical protein